MMSNKESHEEVEGSKEGLETLLSSESVAMDTNNFTNGLSFRKRVAHLDKNYQYQV